jgi:hypothetical protein
MYVALSDFLQLVHLLAEMCIRLDVCRATRRCLKEYYVITDKKYINKITLTMT